jgi:hypothetical protein
MFPSGEPVGYWHSRLAAAGLLSGYRASRNLDQFTKADFEALHSELRSKANEVWGRRMRRQAIQEMIEGDTHGGPLRGNDGSAAAKDRLLKRLDEEREISQHRDNPHKPPQEPAPSNPNSPPETELELSEAFQSLAESGQRTWEAFARSLAKPLPQIFESLLGIDAKTFDEASPKIEEEFVAAQKTFHDILRQLGNQTPTHKQQENMDNPRALAGRAQPSQASLTHKTPSEQRNTRIEESKEEHCDERGYVHSKVIRKELDQDGVEVGRSETYAMYPAPDRMPSRYSGDGSESSKAGDKTGWFWR